MSRDSKDSSSLFDKITTKGRNTKYPIYMHLNAFSAMLIQGFELNTYPILIIPIKKYFNFTEIENSCCVAIIFLGFALGSSISGYLTSYLGRIKVLKTCSLTFLIFHFIMSFFLQSTLFFICRFIIGFALGIHVPIMINLLGEYVPSNSRGFRLQLIYAFFAIGPLFMVIVSLFIMPQLETSQLRNVLLICELLPITAFIINIFFLYDSPRHMLIRGNKEKAFEILEDMNGNKLSNNDKDEIIKEITSSWANANIKEDDISISDLFKPKYYFTSIILIIEDFVAAVGCFGIAIVVTLSQHALNLEAAINDNYSILLSELMVHVFDLFSTFVSAFLIENKSLGRKGSLMLSLGFQFTLAIPTIHLRTFFSILNAIVLFFVNISSNILVAYIVEVYPTKIRDLSSGFHFMITMFSGLISQFLFLGASHINFRLPYYLLSLTCFIACVFVYLLPYETRGKHLDMNMTLAEDLVDENNQGKYVLIE